MVQIFVNDESRNVASGTTIDVLLESLKIEPRQVAVEVNLELVPRDRHAEYQLAEGDRLEVVTLVGGG